MGATALLFRGQRELRAGRPAEALQTLDRAAELRPDCPHAALHRALAFADNGRLDEALEALEQAARRWPANPVFPLFRGALLAEGDRLDEADAALQAARRLSPHNNLAETYSALVAMRRGEIEAPLRRLGATGATDNARALAATLAEVEAALFHRFGTDTDGKPPPPPDEPLPKRVQRLGAKRLAALGLRCLEREDPVGAWALLRLAAEKNPSLPDIFAHLAFAAYDLGRYDDALRCLARVGDWTALPDAVHLHRGACHYKLGRFDAALESLLAAEKADELGNYTAWIQLFITRTLVALGRTTDARPHLRRLIEVEGDMALARLRQARELLGLAVPDSAPVGYDVIEEGRAVLVVKPACADAMRDRCIVGGVSSRRGDDSRDGDVPPTVPPPRTGRAPMQRIALPDGGTALVRQCRRGGLFGRLLGDRHFDGSRFLREIAVSDALRRRGVPTPEIIAGIRRETFSCVYRAEIIVREVPDSLDLAAALRAISEGNGGGTGVPPAADGTPAADASHAARGTRHEVLASAARLVRCVHDAGLWHPDLNARNILIGPDGAALILDLDRAELLDELPLGARFASLARLYRSLHKLGLAPEPVSDADWAGFYAAYAGGDETLRSHADAVMARCRRGLRRHGLWWRFTKRRS